MLRHPAEYIYKNENGCYIMREIKVEQGMIKSRRNIKFNIPANVREWKVVRGYEGFFSAEEIVGQIIEVHMGGRMDV